MKSLGRAILIEEMNIRRSLSRGQHNILEELRKDKLAGIDRWVERLPLLRIEIKTGWKHTGLCLSWCIVVTSAAASFLKYLCYALCLTQPELCHSTGEWIEGGSLKRKLYLFVYVINIGIYYTYVVCI